MSERASERGHGCKRVPVKVRGWVWGWEWVRVQMRVRDPATCITGRELRREDKHSGSGGLLSRTSGRRQ